MVQFVPGQPERLPQMKVLPRGVLLTTMSTPAQPPPGQPMSPALQVSVPVRSVAPMIFEVTVWPGITS